jgi:preprotein translocase subunit SecY
MLSMWFAELITEESLGNGSSMIIFINIVGGIPNNINNLLNTISQNSLSQSAATVFQSILIYLFTVLIIIVFQDAFKKINVVSAKQLITQDESSLQNSFIPLKLNQGGIMPLVFSSTVALVLVSPVQLLLSNLLIGNPGIAATILTVYSFLINLALVIFFSCFYVSLVLKPNDMAENLGKMAYNVPGIRPGKDTANYLEKTIVRLAFIGGVFLAFLAFFPFLVGNLLKITLFKNLTSLLILIGVVTDTTSQIRGYLISTRYEDFKKT